MPIVRLGNDQPIDHATGAPLEGARVTEFRIDPVYPTERAVLALTHVDGGWRAHSAEGTTPSWVWSDDDDLAQALAAHWGCPIEQADEAAVHAGGAPPEEPTESEPAE